MATSDEKQKKPSADMSSRSESIRDSAENDTSRMEITHGEDTERSPDVTDKRGSLLSVRNPFEVVQRMGEQMERMMEGLGFGRWLSPTLGRGLLNDYSDAPWRGDRQSLTAWSPDVEVFKRENELVVRADVPGLDKEDIHVEIRGENLVIDGERREQKEENREGYRYSERRYGRFHREIPLPEGARADDAKASFKEGVLEITMPAPPEESHRGRELSIE